MTERMVLKRGRYIYVTGPGTAGPGESTWERLRCAISNGADAVYFAACPRSSTWNFLPILRQQLAEASHAPCPRPAGSIDHEHALPAMRKLTACPTIKAAAAAGVWMPLS